MSLATISFPQFQNVYCQGELGTKMYFITKGSVALLLREIVGQASQEDFMALADSCVELGRGSFFGEAAVLGHPSRLETIVTTRHHRHEAVLAESIVSMRFRRRTPGLPSTVGQRRPEVILVGAPRRVL